VVWLTGVRRAGKTTLVRSLAETQYYDREHPRIRRVIEEDPEGFLHDLGKGRVILDEIHRIENPSELLKIAADHFPKPRVLATGSSTLGASARFRDTLAGRKRHIHLPPVLYSELSEFTNRDLKTRLLHGGLPENLLATHIPEKDFIEWLDAYWARDIQELFRLEKRSAFLKLLELLLAQSGGLCELNQLAPACGASRQTLSNYLGVLEATGAVHIIRPFSSNRQREIIAMPKVYGFDTGFVCHARGWRDLRQEDLGGLWEHLVLDELRAHFPAGEIFYWRDKQKHEVDFLIARKGQPPIAIECKWKIKSASTKNFPSFKTLYPDARLLLIATDADSPRVNRKLGIVESGLQNLQAAIQLALQ
jgi:predicted AAA+ superfamily ATPase